MGDALAKMGPYRIVRRLGEGGMGTVYEGIHDAIRRRVALKVLRPELARDPEMANRFVNEARAVNLVEHPGLVQVSDYGSLADGTAYIVMEYLKGETLEGRLARSGGKFPFSYALQLAWQIADSLAAAHEKGIVHRDLKPSNVMLVADPHMQIGHRAKILDFGLAKLTESKGGVVVKTHSGAVLGTPLYMSPEQCEGPTRVDAKTDVYALGAMLYEMLAGRNPFHGDSLTQVVAMHLFKEPEPLRNVEPLVPEPLAALVHRALKKDKAQRPTMKEMAHELEELFSLAPPPSKQSLEVPVDSLGDIEALALAATVDQPAEALAAVKSGAARAESIDRQKSLVSTLDQAATEGHDAPGASRRGWILGTAAAMVTVLGLGGGALLFWRGRDQPASAVPVAAQPAQRVVIGVETDPPGAAVIRVSDGQVLGTTPWRQEQAAQPGELRLRLRLAGYVEREVLLSLAKGDVRPVALAAQPAPSATLPADPSGARPLHTRVGKRKLGKQPKGDSGKLDVGKPAEAGKSISGKVPIEN